MNVVDYLSGNSQGILIYILCMNPVRSALRFSTLWYKQVIVVWNVLVLSQSLSSRDAVKMFKELSTVQMLLCQK